MFFLFCTLLSKAQENTIAIKATLDTVTSSLKIQQKITYFNNSKDTLTTLFSHNWANSFKNNKTPLGKRFIEDYQKNFYFSKEKERGYSKIYNLTVNYEQVSFNELQNQPDVLKVLLRKPLLPKDSLLLSTTYLVKIPDIKFTGYGKVGTDYHLRFWYITPAVYRKGWQLMSNLNMDDLYQDIANYTIDINVPKNYKIESNLYPYESEKKGFKNYYLVGKNKKDVILYIDKQQRFKSYQTTNTLVKTDIFDKKIEYTNARKIINREVGFIENYLGKHPHLEILVDASTVNKNSLQEIYGLPDWLKPYPENFRWEIRFFKALTSKYIDDVLLLNRRTDYWVNEGLKTFLMMEYLKKYYPNVKVLGKYANWWLVRSFNLSKLKQSDKFSYLYQFSARKFYDQSLNVSAEKLSNFNRKVISPYKAGLGLKYLQDFVGDSILKTTFKQFYSKNLLKITTSKSFEEILKKNTTKNLDWFFNDYVKTNKKIDYKITKVSNVKKTDSIKVTIKNKREIKAPVALYGVKNKKIKFKKWVSNVDSVKTVTIKNNGFDKLALNYEEIYPEYNSHDNYRNINNSLINKPLQFRFIKDIEAPYYNQIFYRPDVRYNLYDGIILGVNFNNKPIVARNLELSITPNYAFRSNSLTGSFSFGYNHFLPNSKNVYKLKYGVSGSYFHYAENLGYQTFYPYVSLQFKRNSLRDVGSKSLMLRYVYVHKQIHFDSIQKEKDKYKVANIRFVSSEPNAIKGTQYALNLEVANNFSKFSTDIRYRKFFDINKRFDLRFFGGVFLHNKSKGDYFSFGLNRSSDYLFEHNLFGRSESSGLFSRQFVVSDAGFKSFYTNEDSYANQLVTSVNTSTSVWRWAEIYNDVAMLKNKGENPRFFYENGIRLNCIPNIFEFYFPIYTNNGWEVNQPAYPSKIRFVITTNLDQIYNFIRRGIL